MGQRIGGPIVYGPGVRRGNFTSTVLSVSGDIGLAAEGPGVRRGCLMRPAAAYGPGVHHGRVRGQYGRGS